MDHCTDRCFFPGGDKSKKGWDNEPQLRRTKTTTGFCGSLPVLKEPGRMNQEAGQPAHITVRHQTEMDQWRGGLEGQKS